ncbi:hypothetical protein [Zooshikella ganghwensis]|uniref:hypothetical protein n=1 Tax=Zooshikella ganghwensis TaxID=202772 RepID=UPI00197E796C|nr:hypothetical protein [Zooshikella ganghwensis]
MEQPHNGSSLHKKANSGCRDQRCRQGKYQIHQNSLTYPDLIQAQRKYIEYQKSHVYLSLNNLCNLQNYQTHQDQVDLKKNTIAIT